MLFINNQLYLVFCKCSVLATIVLSYSSVPFETAGAVLYEEDLDTDSFQSIEPRRWTPSTNLTSAPKGILKKGGVDSPVSQSPPE